MNVLTRTAGSLGVAAMLAAGAAVPAHAAGDLELSLDGVTWSTLLSEEIFAGAGLIVPGDVVESDLWVRNGSADRARVELDVADALGGVPGTLAGDLTLTIDGAATPGGARWTGPDLAPGTALRIPLVLTFDAASPATTRADVTSVVDAIILTQSAVGPGTVSSAPAAEPHRLPVAGAPTWGSALARTGVDVGGAAGASFAALTLGFVLLAARRRARRTDR